MSNSVRDSTSSNIGSGQNRITVRFDCASIENSEELRKTTSTRESRMSLGRTSSVASARGMQRSLSGRSASRGDRSSRLHVPKLSSLDSPRVSFASTVGRCSFVTNVSGMSSARHSEGSINSEPQSMDKSVWLFKRHSTKVWNKLQRMSSYKQLSESTLAELNKEAMECVKLMEEQPLPEEEKLFRNMSMHSASTRADSFVTEAATQAAVQRAGLMLERQNRVDKNGEAPKLLAYHKVANGLLGQGAYGRVAKCADRRTGRERACKAVSSKETKIKDEVKIMKKLDHPNIIRLHETFEGASNYYMLMDLCKGGELLDLVKKNGRLGDRAVSSIVRQILQAVASCHKNGVVHRDLKPENFLLAEKWSPSMRGEPVLKMVDFGLSAEFKQGERLTARLGTPYYASPQVLNGDYDEKCDVWAAGVMMFFMLVGNQPFRGKNQQEVFAKTKAGHIPWPTVAEHGFELSANAKALIQRMLTMDDKKRPAAADLLNDAYFKEFRATPLDPELTLAVAQGLLRFHLGNRMQKTALNVMAARMDDASLRELARAFVQMDNGHGQMSVEELKFALLSRGCKLPQNVDVMFASLDGDRSDCIEWTEFVAATAATQNRDDDALLWEAFQYFDLNADGKITTEEVCKGLDMEEKDALEIMDEFAPNGEMSLEDFKTMMADYRLGY